MKQQRLVAITFFAMRVALLQLFLCLFFTSLAYDHPAGAQGVLDKTVTISVEKEQLKEVFSELKNQTGAKFVFSSKTIQADRRVSIKVQEKRLGQVLEELFAPYGIKYKIIKDRIVFFRVQTGSSSPGEVPSTGENISDQVTADKEISGQVVDNTGGPLGGVSIVIKGTTTGTNTDLNGNFKLTVPEGKNILVVSYVGYISQEVDITGKVTLNISLVPTVGQLSDIVVVGYGTQKKVTVTGAVTQVKGSELAKSPAVNLSNSLAGRLPGVTAMNGSGEPGYDGSTIRIRGTNTLGSNDALIVIDGIPGRQGGFDRLNPKDIESISVLKDAAAAIYGSRAANGVILITTKRGKTGRPQLSYSFNQGWAQPTIVPNMSDAVQYSEIVNDLTIYKLPTNQWAAATTAFKTTGTYTRTDNGAVVNAPWKPADFTKFKDGSDPWLHPNTDWYKATLKKWAPQSTHNIQVSGGTEAIKYLASIGHQDQDGYYKNSATGYKQYDMRVNLDAKVNKFINVGLGLTARQEDRFFPTRSAQAIFRMQMRGKPNAPAFWPNGLPGPDIENGEQPVVITTDQTGYDKDKRYYYQTNGRIEVNIPWIKGLKYIGTASIDKYVRQTKRWQIPWFLYNFNGFEADGVTPRMVAVKRGPAEPALNQATEDQMNILLGSTLTYDRTFLKDHTVSLVAGLQKETIENNNFNAFRRYFISPAVDQMFAGGDLLKDNGGGAFERARLDYFGRVAYNYKEKYLVEFLWRYDGTYMFPEKTRYGFFPGILAGYRISEENFFRNNVKFIDNLKIRGSWGQMGNDQVTFGGVLQEYAYLATYGLDRTYIIGDALFKTLYERRVPNPTITWEVANNANIGLEGAVLNSKLTFEFEYFYNKRTKILIARNASIPQSTGMTLPPENLGRVDNKGWEFNIGYHSHVRDFNYSVSVNGGYAKNKIVFWDEAPGAKDWQRTTGMPIGSGLFYTYDGVFIDQEDINKKTLDYTMANVRPGDMKFKDINGDGKINGDDAQRIGKTTQPRFTGGLNINLSYRNFDLSILFQGATGGQLYIGTESGDIGNYLEYDYNHRWTVENPSSVYPRLSNRGDQYYSPNGAYGNNTYWLRKTDYLRLKNFELGYNLPASIGSKAGINNMRFYVNGLNLFTFDETDVFDPEATRSDGQYYPQARVINVGVSVTF
jgi:TonB-linked SusC/RagA family outer membrane protein